MAYRDTDYEKEYVKGHVAGFEKGCTNGYVSGIAEGRRLEREAIVAWLRTLCARCHGSQASAHDDGWCDKCSGTGIYRYADRIERGEHEKGKEG